MESQPNPTPLIAIVGQTATGKTTLAIELAKRFNGEIIAADSRTIYRGLDIGTAKPSAQEQHEVPHHLLDVVDPSESFSAAQFKQLAQSAIQDIASRGRLPILVGGTGLYVDAVLYNYTFSDKPDPAERLALQQLSIPKLQAILQSRGIQLPTNAQNPRHLIRTIENDGQLPQKSSLRPNTLVLGLQADRELLQERITKRVDEMVNQGLVTETSNAAKAFGWGAPGLQSTGYKALRGYIEGELTLDEAKLLFVRNDMQLAKRQKTWFKRSADIHWISKIEESVDLVTTLLNK